MKKGKRAKTVIVGGKKPTTESDGGPRANGRMAGRDPGLRHPKTTRIENNARLELIPNRKEKSTYKKAMGLARLNKNADAAELLMQSHKEGDRRATYALATWYLHGKVFPVDAKKSFQLLRQSSRAGIAEALYDLGRSFEVGFGAPKSAQKSYECYLEAAQRGDEGAARAVVRCIYWGIGVQKDRKLAFYIDDLIHNKVKYSRPG